jgi:hypothetical protein
MDFKGMASQASNMKAGRYRARRLAMNNILVSERQPAWASGDPRG